MYVVEGEKVLDDCIFCDYVYFLCFCYVVSVEGLDLLLMVIVVDCGFLLRDLKCIVCEKKKWLIMFDFI